MAAAADQLNVRSVTGVELSLRIAGPGVRSYAFIVDWHIRLLLALAWLLGASLLAPGDFAGEERLDTLHVYVAVLPSLALYLFYHPVLEILMRGRTPGKRMAGVKIVSREGSVPGVAALLIRNVFRLIDALPTAYAIGLAMTLLTRQQVRIGDLAAGTLLVYEEVQPAASLRHVAQLGGSRLDVAQAELVQDLLGRWKELEPALRLQFGRRLLARLGDGEPPADETAVRRALEALLGR